MSPTQARIRSWISDPELGICQGLNRWGTRRPICAVFCTLSRLGDGPVWYALMTALAVFGGRKGALAGLHLAIVGLCCLLLYRGLKRGTRRLRPFARHPSIQALIQPLDEYSFPSGHTLHASAFTVVACAYFPSLAWLLVPLALLIALSRVVLGLHYPSDVLAAIVIGCALAGSSLPLMQ